MMQRTIKLAFSTILLIPATNAFAKKNDIITYTVQWQALAPNAGGQNAYAFRRGSDQGEWGVFVNEYLLSNGQPLVGATYDFRFPICDSTCLIQAFFQAGGGLTSGGPVLEMNWSTILLWIARVDFTTQLYFSKQRMITWSYPLWLGLSIPIP